MISIYAATAFEEVTSAILDVYRRIYIKINELTKLTDRRWPTVYPAFLSRLTNCKFLSLFSITSAGMVLDSSLLTTKLKKNQNVNCSKTPHFCSSYTWCTFLKWPTIICTGLKHNTLFFDEITVFFYHEINLQNLTSNWFKNHNLHIIFFQLFNSPKFYSFWSKQVSLSMSV